MNRQELQDKIEKAASVIGKTWPLYSFVTSNPLSGYEEKPFFEGIEEAGNLWNARVLPDAKVFQQAWEENKIGRNEIEQVLAEFDKKESPEFYLELLKEELKDSVNEFHELDYLTAKWVALFLDEGMAEWPMPFKELGFYLAWRNLVVYDKDIRKKLGGAIPKTPEEALSRVLSNYTASEQKKLLERHLVALPGWAGYIKYRVENGSKWNKKYPIDLLEYLAVRLWMARCLNVQIKPDLLPERNHPTLEMKQLWVKAWEQTWQNRCFEKLKEVQSKSKPSEESTDRPDAQLVFCLDSRSELLRRHLESLGDYETFGSAGAFGLTMNYADPETGLINKSSPAMAPSKYLVQEKVKNGTKEGVNQYKQVGKKINAHNYFFKRMKHILPSAFGFVETAGYYYGIYILLRLFFPNWAEKMMLKHHKGYEKLFAPHIYPMEGDNLAKEISVDEKAQLVKGVFDSCGWTNFAPIVVFTGHASHSANNPFASSLDCGACAGNPGKRNARTLARLANSKQVREVLKDKYNTVIPEDTIFIPAEHITSSDEVKLFVNEISNENKNILEQLQKDLLEVRRRMTKERLNEPNNAENLAKIKSNSWSETRPEWGLSGHAGYIIGPRTLTKKGVFDDCFMSSYDWKIDKDGSILKGILQGPLLVCQWISNHYYFSTVDNEIFGGGSKIVHNITGKFGVVQGNGSDLKMGLPLQSLMKTDDKVYHNPIRLSTVIQAPRHFVENILKNDKKLDSLVNNGWIHLFIMDPEKENKIENYKSVGL